MADDNNKERSVGSKLEDAMGIGEREGSASRARLIARAPAPAKEKNEGPHLCGGTGRFQTARVDRGEP